MLTYPRLRSAGARRSWHPLPAPASLLVALSLLALAALGCEGASTARTDDASVAYDTAVTRRLALRVEGDTLLTIEPLAERTLRVQLTEDDAPVEGARITFAIEGAARSSTLRALEDVTRADGVASVTLVAGPLPTTFRLRMTTPGAAAATVDVSVGNEFGDLDVGLDADVTRPIASYLVRALADVPCTDAFSTPSEGERELDPDAGSTRYLSLPTSPAWTLAIRGRSSAGVTLARGCVEGVRVEPGSLAEVSVAVHDLPLTLEGTFALEFDVDASVVAQTIGARLIDERTADDDAALLLDGLARTLEERDDGRSAAMALARARTAGLDARVAEALEAADSAWSTRAAPLTAVIDEAFSRASFRATLGVGETVRVSSFRVRLGERELDGRFEASLERLAAVPSRDRVFIAGLSVDVTALATWLDAIGAALAEGPDVPSTPFADDASCDALAGALLSVDPRALDCDEACVRRGCDAAEDLLLSSLRERSTELAARAARLRFEGELPMFDDDQDLRVERVDGETPIRWESADGASAFELPARVHAERDRSVD